MGYHEEVVKSVLAGDFDVGAVMESVFDLYKEDGIRAVGSSDEIPEFLIGAGESLSPPPHSGAASSRRLRDQRAGAPRGRQRRG